MEPRAFYWRSAEVALYIILSTLLTAAVFGTALAHEVRPSVADVSVTDDRVVIDLRVVLEPLIAGIDVGSVEDTNDSPLAGVHDRLRAEPPEALEVAFRRVWPELAEGVVLRAGDTALAPEIDTLSVGEIGDTDVSRDSRLVLSAALPPDGTPVQVGWAPRYGSLVVRQAEGGAEAYAAILQGGDLSAPLPRSGTVDEDAGTVFVRYVVSGFEHIVPKGLDHILFVLGLFFFALKAGPLLWQVTAFTLAHTVTLALASLGIVTLPASVVEPLIAASIVFVAVENIRGGTVGPVRVAVVFVFGLLHGLGFASVLGDVGLEAGRFVVGLIGFNIGVELGQLAVIAAAFAAIRVAVRAARFARLDEAETPVREMAVTFRAVSITGSLLIAVIGAWWTIERVFFG